ncbi:uncharacterized protein si:ch211-102c2.4 [Labrus bergylta]|uniref:uncharacterized protein si:ch211-102c2.4 n=1 Tax=Labrus bergylta TaxID=56723 RepID=UPI003314126F
MHALILILLFAVGACEEVYRQKLTCPYELKNESLQRVWCRQSSADCCTGFTFGESAHVLDGGKLEVTQGLASFTVSVLVPSHGEGVYWCGLLGKNNTIIKVAEGYLHHSAASGHHIWSIIRWILLLLLLMVTTFANLYSRATSRHMFKKEEELYDDIDIPQIEEAIYELE